jgi:hypothetical protein
MTILWITSIILLVLFVLPMVINILQNGPRRWKGQSLKEILGMDPEQATVQDIEKLSKADVMQLFYAAEAPEFSELKGECNTKILHVGLFGRTGDFYVNSLMGPGYWEGDAFSPLSQETGHGYNIFRLRKNGNDVFLRTLRMDTSIMKSTLDNKDAFHVIYRRYGKGLNKSMRDEVRKINNNLYLGVAFFSWTGGRINPFPFVIYGPPSAWIGPDE